MAWCWCPSFPRTLLPCGVDVGGGVLLCGHEVTSTAGLVGVHMMATCQLAEPFFLMCFFVVWLFAAPLLFVQSTIRPLELTSNLEAWYLPVTCHLQKRGPYHTSKPNQKTQKKPGAHVNRPYSVGSPGPQVYEKKRPKSPKKSPRASYATCFPVSVGTCLH